MSSVTTVRARLQKSLAKAAADTRNTAKFQRYLQVQSQKPQFTKVQAYFVKQSFTPASCSSCPWYAGTSISPLGMCSIVSSAGPPASGQIPPDGICGLYWATPTRIGVYARAYGRGAGVKGVLPQAIRHKVEAKRMAFNDPMDIPPELTTTSAP